MYLPPGCDDLHCAAVHLFYVRAAAVKLNHSTLRLAYERANFSVETANSKTVHSVTKMTRSKDLILKRLRDEVGLTKSTSKRIAQKLDALSQSVKWATPPTKRKKLPSDRQAITHKFSIGGHEGFLTVGKYQDGAPGELLIKLAKEGSTLSGVLDGLSIAFSLALQYGVPLRAIVDKFVNMKFEPSGYTGNPRIRYAKSLLDYVGRYLGGLFISPDYFDTPASDGSPSAKPAPVRTTRAGRSELKTSRLHRTTKRD